VYDDGLPDPPAPPDSTWDPLEVFACEEGLRAPRRGYYGGDPRLRSTATGNAGELADACDVDGNLEERFCETRVAGDCIEQPNAPSCPREFTGEVLAQLYDCAGSCVDGTCKMGCPAFFDRLLIESQGPDGIVVADLTLGERIQCTLGDDWDGDDIDCSTIEGQDAFIYTRGVSGFCTGPIGSLGICLNEANNCARQQCTLSDCVRID
jgi:hypothetical protein